MGVVYRRKTLNFGRFVALKFLPQDLAKDRKLSNAFAGKLRAASALNHPNICTIYEIGRHEKANPSLSWSIWTSDTQVPHAGRP